MVIRRISVRLYLAAAALVVAVVATGWALEGLVNRGRANELERRWGHLRGGPLPRASPERCPEPRAALYDTVEGTSAIRRKLDGYLNSPFGNSNGRVTELKRDLVRATLAHWEAATALRAACGSALPPVLYLYWGKNCSRCYLQTKILLFIERRHRPELLVFPVDVDFAPPEQVSRLMRLYAVARVPASIISEKAYEGFLSTKMLQKILVSEHL